MSVISIQEKFPSVNENLIVEFSYHKDSLGLIRTMRQQKTVSRSRSNYPIYVSVALLCALISIGLPATELDNEGADSFEGLTYPTTFFCAQGLSGSVQIIGFRGCSHVIEYHQIIDKEDCVTVKVVKPLDYMSPGLTIRAMNQKPIEVASLVILRNESAPFEYLRVELSDVTVEKAEIVSEDSGIGEETIELSPRRLVYHIVPFEDDRRSGVSGELKCRR